MRVERPQPAEDTFAADERRQAARALLLRPLLIAGGPHEDHFRLVRRHRDHLTRLFADALGYRLVVDSRSARLYKAGLGNDATRSLRRRNGAAFTPRGYALLCLTLAALIGAKSQLLVDELVAEVRSAAADAGVGIDLDKFAERRLLHAVLMVLLERGVLRERDADGGGLARWAEDAAAKSLLDVDRDRLRLVIPTQISSAASPADLLDVAALPSAAGGARVAIRRRLLESPVMSAAELSPDQVEWWGKNRNREQERLRDLFGVELELRAEGGLVLDPDEELSDVAFPGVGAVKQFALLVLERLVSWVQESGPDELGSADDGWRAVPANVVASTFDEVIGDYRRALTKDYRADPAALSGDVLALLSDVGLARIGEAGAWVLHPAAARYATKTQFVAAGSGGQPSPFEAGDGT